MRVSDEKRLEIGRNANFKESLFKEWLDQLDQTERKMTIICSVYDIYMTYNEEILIREAVAYEFINYFKRHKDKIEQLVLLFPANTKNETETEALLAMNDFIRMSEELTDNIIVILLTCYYGPWQPKTFAFQHTILTKMNKQEEFKGLREETIDALYIDEYR